MTTLLTRDQWIAACHFHDLSEREVLREIGRRVGNARDRAAEGHHLAHPLVLLDLDSTLYEVGPRTHQILLEWTETQNARSFGFSRCINSNPKVPQYCCLSRSNTSSRV